MIFSLTPADINTMKKLTLGIFAMLLIGLVPAMSQKKSSNDKSDVVVTIKVDGREQDIEAYFENWGEEFGRKMERMFDDSHVDIDIDEDDFDIDVDISGVYISDLAESIADVVSEAISNMTITLKDIDPDDIDDNECNLRGGKDLDDVLEEIESKYGSPVKNIDNMTIKIREDHVKIDMDLTLENGKKIQKTEIYAD
jgi:uncharacterized alkaline shock family protein YloU